MRLNHFEIPLTLLSSPQIKVERSGSGIDLEKAYKQLSRDGFYQRIDQDVTQMQHKEVANAIGQVIRWGIAMGT